MVRNCVLRRSRLSEAERKRVGGRGESADITEMVLLNTRTVARNTDTVAKTGGLWREDLVEGTMALQLSTDASRCQLSTDMRVDNSAADRNYHSARSHDSTPLNTQSELG